MMICCICFNISCFKELMIFEYVEPLTHIFSLILSSLNKIRIRSYKQTYTIKHVRSGITAWDNCTYLVYRMAYPYTHVRLSTLYVALLRNSLKLFLHTFHVHFSYRRCYLYYHFNVYGIMGVEVKRTRVKVPTRKAHTRTLSDNAYKIPSFSYRFTLKPLSSRRQTCFPV